MHIWQMGNKAHYSRSVYRCPLENLKLLTEKMVIIWTCGTS